MKRTILVMIIVAFAAKAFADDCATPPCEIKVKRPDLAATIGGTAAAGLFAAPFGLESALTSMGVAGGVSLLTSAITNSDQKMFIKLQNRAAKAVKKKKLDIPCKNVREGDYKALHGSCKASPESFQLVKADEKMASAYYAEFDNAVHAVLLLDDGTMTIFDESAKKVMCNGFIKSGSFAKTIVLYCLDSDWRFCNRSYQLVENAK